MNNYNSSFLFWHLAIIHTHKNISISFYTFSYTPFVILPNYLNLLSHYYTVLPNAVVCSCCSETEREGDKPQALPEEATETVRLAITFALFLACV